MKLISKVSLNYFLLTSVILLVGSVTAYLFIKQEVDEKIDFRLFDEKGVIQQISKPSELLGYKQIFADHFEVTQLAEGQTFQEEIKDTSIVTPFRMRPIPYRQISFARTFSDSAYKIVLRKTMVDSHDLTDGLLRGLTVAGLGLLLVLMITNYAASKKIWSPFSKTIKEISRYDVTDNQPLRLPGVKITELNQLNNAVNAMADKIQRDYFNLKEFSENASHEMQTPLSVIQSKTELLMQSDGLSDDQVHQIQAINRASKKLARLNQALLLLAKIENRQFKNESELDLKELLEKQLDDIGELAEMNSLTINKELKPARPIQMNSVLADALVRNLLSNAIKYSTRPGTINITLIDSKLCLANMGKPLKSLPAQYFERFKKDDQSSESLGLGLAIVKRICEYYNFQIHYDYKEALHTFTIRFQS